MARRAAKKDMPDGKPDGNQEGGLIGGHDERGSGDDGVSKKSRKAHQDVSVPSVHRDKVFVYLVYPEGTQFCECNKENPTPHMPCNCEFTYKRRVYSSIRQMHDGVKAGVGYSCGVCKKHVVRDVGSQHTCCNTQPQRAHDRFVSVADFQTHSQACTGNGGILLDALTNKESGMDPDRSKNANSRTPEGDNDDNNGNGVKMIEFMQCTVCGCYCQDLPSLNQHLKSHIEPRADQTTTADVGATDVSGSDQTAKRNSVFTICTVCGCCCDDETTLSEHLKSHAFVLTDQIVGVCSNPSSASTSGARSKTKRNVTLPVRQVHVPFKYACPVCKMKFITMKELEEHKVAMHFSKHKKIAPATAKGAILLPIPVSLTTSLCMKSGKGGKMTKDSSSPDHLYSVLQLQGNKKWKCGECQDSFKTRDDLRLHVSSEHRKAYGARWNWKWQCDVCAEVCASRDKWKSHMKNHKRGGSLTDEKGSKQQNWLCTVCGFCFDTEVHLAAHIKAGHADGDPKSAQEASYIEVAFADFNKDLPSTNSGDVEMQEAGDDESDRETSSDKKKKEDATGDLTTSLTVETVDPTDGAKWKCHICNDAYKNRDDLRLHVQMEHKGGYKRRGKEWQCLVCKLLLPTRDRWKAHGKIHKGERRGACAECGIYFEDDEKYNAHLKAVHGTRNAMDHESMYIVVGDYDESVSGMGSSGVWPCNFCSLQCKNHVAFQKHVKEVHGEESAMMDECWPCLECPSAFRSVKELMNHAENRHDTGKQWSCATCGVTVQGSAKLREHMEAHARMCTAPPKTNANRWICSECGEIFETRDELRLHRKDHLRKKNRLKCALCGWVFASETELDYHSQNHMLDFEELKCNECRGVFFSTVDDLKTHLSVHKDLCQLCGFKFTILHNSEKHVKVCALEGRSRDFGENARCPECGEEFQKSVQFRLHMARHASRREKLKCKICGKLFQNVREVIQHKQISHKSDCHMCLKRFDTVGDLSDHLETHVECLYCHKKFDNYSSCKRHMESYCHTRLAAKGMAPRTKFPSIPIGHRMKKVPMKCECYCDQCGKKFNTQEAMKSHRIVHFRGKFKTPEKCPDCDETFNYETQLRMHKQAVHWPEKPFPCVYCQTRFKTSDDLLEHEAIHTKDKPHTCPMCPRKFKSKHAIKYHLNMHTGLKPFKCSYCAKTFGQPGQKATHERRHEGRRPYKCTVCDCAYTYGPSLKIHLKTHIR